MNLVLRDCVRAQRGRCMYCSRPMHFKGQAGCRPTIDHKEPIWSGGQDVAENRGAACTDCNNSKGPLDAETFLRHRRDPGMLRDLRRQVEEVARHSAIARRREAEAKL